MTQQLFGEKDRHCVERLRKKNPVIQALLVRWSLFSGARARVGLRGIYRTSRSGQKVGPNQKADVTPTNERTNKISNVCKGLAVDRPSWFVATRIGWSVASSRVDGSYSLKERRRRRRMFCGWRT